MTDEPVSWLTLFRHSGGPWNKDEPDFPEFEVSCPDRETSMAQGKRVLSELRDRGDIRDWMAKGYPLPFKYDGLLDAWDLGPLERD